MHEVAPGPVHTRVAIVTDSVACLPDAVARAHGMYRLPVKLSVNGCSYEDTERDLTPALVDAFRGAVTIDTTPWPPEHYSRFYAQLALRHDEILHIVAFSTFTSTMSLAQEGARLASSSRPGLRVEIVDSGTTGMAQGFVALAAARAALSGASLEDCRNAAHAMTGHVQSLFALESLRHVTRTGRATRLAGWASSVLRVTPVVRLVGGREEPVFLARSTSQAIRRMAALVATSGADAAPLHAAVMESEPGQDGCMLADLLHERVRCIQCLVTPFTPVMRIVAGPGVVGVAFYRD